MLSARCMYRMRDRRHIPIQCAEGSPMIASEVGYMTRECLPARRATWRQKVQIVDRDDGRTHTFYVEFGEYPDGRLAELFVTGHRLDTFARGALDALARTASLALQSGTSPHEVAHTLRGMDYPPRGRVQAEGSAITEASSLADYIGQEIEASYGTDGKQRATPL